MNVSIDVRGFDMTDAQKVTLGRFIVDEVTLGLKQGEWPHGAEGEIHVEESAVFDNEVKIETMNEETHWYIKPDGELEAVS